MPLTKSDFEKITFEALSVLRENYDLSQAIIIVSESLFMDAVSKDLIAEIGNTKELILNVQQDLQIPEYRKIKNIIEAELSKDKELTAQDYTIFIQRMVTSYNDSRRDGVCFTPDNLSKLVCNLLDVKGTDTIYDLGSGIGNFLLTADQIGTNHNGHPHLIGLEINQNFGIISRILLTLQDANFEIIHGNALTDESNLKYTKAYTFSPFGVHYPSAVTEAINWKFGDLFNSRSNSEWFFIMQALSMLPTNGMAVALLPDGALFRATDRNIRKYLIEKKLLKGVISLPTRIWRSTGVKTSLVIFGPSDGNFKALDATEMCHPDEHGHLNIVDDEAVFAAYNSSEVTTHTYSEVVENDYNLNMSMYMNEDVNKQIDCPTPISDIAKVIVGSQYTVSHFKKVFKDNSDYLLIASSNIANGAIQYDTLQGIEPDAKLEKYELQKGDIVLTTKSTRVKTAVMNDPQGKHYIVTGGMLIVRPDLKRVNPVYLKMFFDSEIGRTVLRSVQNGTIITTISISSFNRLEVACPSLEIQNKLANKYDTTLSMYGVLKEQLDDVQAQLETMYDDSLKGDE